MQIWDDFLAKLDLILGKQNVDQWLRTLKVLRFDAANLYLEAEDHFQVLFFEEHVQKEAQTQLLSPRHRPIKIHLSSPTPLKKPHSTPLPSPATIAPHAGDPEMTFENFLLTPENQVAVEILQRGEFNPIFLYGPKGSGKTHLLNHRGRWG